MSNIDQNPRERIGGNEPPLSKRISEEQDFGASTLAYLQDEYRDIERTTTDLLAEARELPERVADDGQLGIFASLIKRLRDTASRAEGLRVKETEPYLRAQNSINAFFFGIQDRLRRRSGQRNAKAGAADILQARVDEYQQEKLRREQAERDRIAREERRKAEAAENERRRLAEEAAEKKAAAERARKAETQAAKIAAAEKATEEAAVAAAAAATAVEHAQEAHINTLAKPADMVRTRTEGAMVTMAKEKYALVVDESKLDKAALWPFIPIAAKEQALRAWAKTTGHRQQMEGAEIGERNKSVVR